MGHLAAEGAWRGPRASRRHHGALRSPAAKLAAAGVSRRRALSQPGRWSSLGRGCRSGSCRGTRSADLPSYSTGSCPLSYRVFQRCREWRAQGSCWPPGAQGRGTRQQRTCGQLRGVYYGSRWRQLPSYRTAAPPGEWYCSRTNRSAGGVSCATRQRDCLGYGRGADLAAAEAGRQGLRSCRLRHWSSRCCPPGWVRCTLAAFASFGFCLLKFLTTWAGGLVFGTRCQDGPAHGGV